MSDARLEIEDIEGPDLMKIELEMAGVGRKLLARRIKQGLAAKETKFFSHQGVVLERHNVVDYATRRQYVDLSLRIYGDYSAEKHDHKVSQPVVVQIVEQPGCPELPRAGKVGADDPVA